MQIYSLRAKMAFTFSRFMMRNMERSLIFARPSKHFSKAHGVRNSLLRRYFLLIYCDPDRIWPRSSDLPGLPWSELVENPEEYFHPSLHWQLKSTITFLHPEKMSPVDLRKLSDAIISFQSNAETSSSAIFQSKAVISNARVRRSTQKEVEKVDEQEPEEIFDHSRSPSPNIASPLEAAHSNSTPSLLSLTQSPPAYPPVTPNHGSRNSDACKPHQPTTPAMFPQPNTTTKVHLAPSPPTYPPVTPNHSSRNSDSCEPHQPTTPAMLPEPITTTMVHLAPSVTLHRTPSPPHSESSPSSPQAPSPPISTVLESPSDASMPTYIQSLPTGKCQKRKHDIVDEAPPAVLGRRNRKISKKAQGRNFDEKSGDEEKDDSECIAKDVISVMKRTRSRIGAAAGYRRQQPSFVRSPPFRCSLLNQTRRKLIRLGLTRSP